MNINRHNYEESFILYMDNELGSEERRMVEEFVQLHPDLKEELEILQQFKLTPDTNIVFAGKNELLKGEEASSVTLSNYEEWLMLYTDNELDAEQKAAVEQFVAKNPAVQQELTLLLQTRLQPERVIFTNKESLYRREEKVRALPIRWWRAAAAVLLIGSGITTAIILNNKKSPGTSIEVAGVTNEKQKTTPVETVQPKKDAVAVTEVQDEPATNPSIKNRQQDNNTPAYKQANNPVAVTDNNTVIKNDAPEKNNVPVIADKSSSNNLPKPENNPYVNNKAVDAAIAKTDIPEITNKTTSLTDRVVTSPSAQPSDYRTASVNESDLNQGDGKKNKLRGLFRKVTRTFEKRTNIDPTDDDDRLLVGGLAIRLK